MRINPDNPLLLGLQTVFDVLAAAFFFILCCLPAVTAGAALIAVYDTMMDIAMGRCVSVMEKFFTSFRANWKPGCKLLVPAVLAGFLLYLDIYACWGRALEPSVPLSCMKGLTIFALVVSLAFLSYAAAGTAKYIVTLRQSLHNALCWIMGRPLPALGVAGLWIVMALALWVVWFYAFFVIAAGLYGQARLMRWAMFGPLPEDGGMYEE